MGIGKFKMDTSKELQGVLSNINQLSSLRYTSSGYDASDILIDYLRAYEKAGLTEKQEKIINLVYKREYTQKEAAEILGCSQQAVQQHIKASFKKIVEAYKGDLPGEQGK
ncbi:sigma factor-like helix-turn-helix DNA-binding protein [Alkaliphilus peptidifermentans]|nr:sigma factor-like helix-turn-helix DNA-binding protein [Alkaliphilus peptidifermentans]